MLLVLAVVLSQRIDFGVLFSPAANHAAIFLFGIVLARFAPPRRSLVVGLGAAALFALVAALNFALPQTLWSFLAVSVTLAGIAGPLALYALLRRYSDPRFAGS